MSEMVDRVARAICRVRAGYLDARSDAELGELWQTYKPAARAVIAAMREPTEAMVKAGMPGPINVPDRIWRAMIDAALAD